jgi:hypothetical protein
MNIDQNVVKIMAEEKMVMGYNPSHYGNGGYFKLVGNSLVEISKAEVLTRPEKLCGWSIYIWTWQLKKKRIAIFLHRDVIWMFLNGQYFPIHPKDFFRKTFLFWTRAVFMNEGKVIARLEYFTPPLRYLNDDGMMPESVEPLNDILNDLSKKDDYIEKIAFLKQQGNIVAKQNS